jgi:hypothetical protein
MKNNSRLIFFWLVTIGLRLLPHLPNAAPVGALALLVGAHSDKKTSTILLISAMLATDFFLGFHPLMPWVYGSFLAISLIPKLVPKFAGVGKLGFAIAASLLFFIVTNFAVWLTSSAYSQDLQGLLYCYWNAIPFLRNTLIGDALYTFVFFRLYESCPNFSLSLKDIWRKVPNPITLQ